MRCIIAGSRNIVSDSRLMEKVVQASGFLDKITVVISGTARGADIMGEVWARKRGIPVERFLAEWDKYGKSAGYKRNEQMAENADALIAVWDGESKGTKHMIDIATRKGLKVFIYDATQPIDTGKGEVV